MAYPSPTPELPGTMRAAILYGPGKFEVETRPLPDVGPEDILVRTAACGICTSEIDFWTGKAKGLEYPRFIGHEPAGVVAAVGDRVRGFVPGDHVSVWSEGKSFAEFFAAPASYAAKLNPSLPLEQALGEPIACATNGVRKADPQFNDTVCIVGCGFMGLIMLQVFRARGAGMIVAVDTRASIRNLAARLGADHVFDPSATNVPEAVLNLTGGRGVDIGVEAAGNQAVLDLTGKVVRMEGKLEVFGFHQGEPRLVPLGFWNWMAFTIVNAHVRSPVTYVEGMRMGLGLLESGRLSMEPLVTHRFPLEEIGRAFDAAAAKHEGFVKGVITFPSTEVAT